jgi:hypothetical protein
MAKHTKVLMRFFLLMMKRELNYKDTLIEFNEEGVENERKRQKKEKEKRTFKRTEKEITWVEKYPW